MSTRNITLTLPAELVRRAKIIAATRDTSVSGLVAEYLERMTQEDDDYDDMWQEERRLMTAGLPMRIGEITWVRDDVHER